MKRFLSLISAVVFVIAIASPALAQNSMAASPPAKNKAAASSTMNQGKNEAKNFKPGDKVYAVAQIANNSGTVQAKFRVLYDDVEGQTAGTLVQGAEKTLDVEGDRPAIFWITLPPSGFQNGRYKVETSMLYSGEQKDQKSATFDVSGY